MAKKSELDDILNDLILVANGTIRVNFDAKHETKMHIKHLILRLIGKDEIGFTDHWGETHNVRTDDQRSKNQLREKLRQKVKDL